MKMVSLTSYFFRLYRERLTQIEAKLTEVRAGRAQVNTEIIYSSLAVIFFDTPSLRTIDYASMYCIVCYVENLSTGVPSASGGFAI